MRNYSTIDVKTNGLYCDTWFYAPDVDTERAKDKEELRKNKVTISTQSVFLNMRTKR